MSADLTQAVAEHVFRGGLSSDPELRAVAARLRELDPYTVLDEVDVAVIRGALDDYRAAQQAR